MKTKKITLASLANDLEKLSKRMADIGTKVMFYGPTIHARPRGKELVGAARMVKEWAKELRKK